MKEQNQDLTQMRSHLAYFRQVADIHLAIYKAQSLSGLSKYEQHIVFHEMISVLQAASTVNPDEEHKMTKQDKVLGRKKSTVSKSILETERIVEEFGAAENPKNSGKLAKKHWGKISKKIVENSPNFDHFFKIAEEKYKAIDGLVKLNKENCKDDEEELKFLLNIQQQARFNIMEINRLKHDIETRAIKAKQDLLNNRQKEITPALVPLRLALSEENEPEEGLDKDSELKRSLRKSHDIINLKSGDVAAASKSVILLKGQIVQIHQQMAQKQTRKETTELQIKLLETEQTSLGAACDVLWEEKRKVTENYIKAYCNYRQNWTKDDGEIANKPLWNCIALNFKKTPINDGSILSPDTHESGLVLDGINFGDIPITLAELATADSASLGKIVGIKRDQAIALGKMKQTAILGVEKKSDTTIQAGDLIGGLQDIDYNHNFPSNSYSLWLQDGEKWEELKQKKQKQKDEAVSGRGRSLSNLVRIRFRSNTAETKAPSTPADDASGVFNVEPAESRDTDQESSSNNDREESRSGSESGDNQVESKKDIANKTIGMWIEGTSDDEREESRSDSESKTPLKTPVHPEPSFTEDTIATKSSLLIPIAAPSANTKKGPSSAASMFERMRSKATEKPKIKAAAEKPKIPKEQDSNFDDDTELEPTTLPDPVASRSADISSSSHTSSSSSPLYSQSSPVSTSELQKKPLGVYISLGHDIVGPGPTSPQSLKNSIEENKASKVTQEIAKTPKGTPSDDAKSGRSWRNMFSSKTKTPTTQQALPTGNVETKSGTMTTVSGYSAYPGMIASPRGSESESRNLEFEVGGADGFGVIDAEAERDRSATLTKPSSSVKKPPEASKTSHSRLKPPPKEQFQEF